MCRCRYVCQIPHVKPHFCDKPPILQTLSPILSRVFLPTFVRPTVRPTQIWGCFRGCWIQAFEGHKNGQKSAFERLFERLKLLCDSTLWQTQQTPPKSPFYGRVAGFFVCDGYVILSQNRAKFWPFSGCFRGRCDISAFNTVQIGAKCDGEGTQCDISFFR